MGKRMDILSADVTNFLKIYTDFAFFLFISPVRFSRHSKTQLFSVKSWWPQKILSGVASFFSLFWLLRMVRQSVPSQNEKKASVYFDLVLNIIGLSVKSITVKRLWWNQHELLEILNFVGRNTTNLPVERHNISKLSRKVLVFCVSFLYAGVGINSFVTGVGLGHISEWSGTWWWQGVSKAACFNFFLSNSTCSWVTTSEWSWIVGVPAAIGFYQRHLLGLYCELFLFSGVLTLWTCTRSFALLLQQDIAFFDKTSSLDICNDTTGMVIFTKKWIHNTGIINGFDQWLYRHGQYRTLQKLVILMNSAFGTNMTLFLADAILYYSTSFNQLLIEDGSHRDGGKLFRLFFLFLNTCAILVFAADIPCQIVNTMKEWLSSEGIKGNVPIDQLHIYINDLDMNAVAMRGSNIFPVTFPIIAQMLVVTVTYFVICMEN